MVVPVLSTKLFIPPLKPNYVSRSSLIKKLNDGLENGNLLTILSAPAGFGKTTLMSEWVSVCGLPVAWLSLDESDSTLSSFLIYLVNALLSIKVGVGVETLAALQSPQPQPNESLLINFLNEIAASQDKFILVLDDYHAIDSKEVDQCLKFIVEHQPQQMHLVIASREDPPLALPRLRARGQLSELRADDLRFTHFEASDFLNRVMSLKLTSDEISVLDTQIEGWAAGMQLAALSMQGNTDTSTFIKTFAESHRFVLDYLLEEVLRQQPGHIQDFLLRTSILNRLCEPLCDAVMDGVAAQEKPTLQDLDHANLFIIPLDQERLWYRYHHLFRDLLRKQLGQRLTFAEINCSHVRASHWYQQNGDLAEAIHHSLLATDFERAAELAEQVYREMDDNFQSAAWLAWVKKLPNKEIETHPLLCTQIGMAYTDAGDLETSETYLLTADHYLGQIGENPRYLSLPAMVAIAHAANAQRRGDIPATVKYAELTLKLTPEGDILQRAQANVTLGFTHWFNGDLESALKATNEWMHSMGKIGNSVFVVASAFALADILIGLGRLGEAEESLKQSLELAASNGEEAEKITAHHYLGLAMITRERGENETFTILLQKAQELGKNTTLEDWTYRWNLAQAMFNEGEGDYEAALNYFDEAKKAYVQNPIPDNRPIEALKARIYLKQGKLDKAKMWVRKSGLSVLDQVNYLTEFEHLMLARTRIAEQDFAGVDEMLERLLKVAEAQSRINSMLEILLTQFLSYHAQGNQVQGINSLERALALAEPEGYIRMFIDEGETMRSQIEMLSKNHNHPLRVYIAKLNSAFTRPLRNVAKSFTNPQINGLIEPLTDRELEILRLIAQGLTNTEISQRLYLAISTIKGHNLRIFNKLQANNRTEAVACARELGLL